MWWNNAVSSFTPRYNNFDRSVINTVPHDVVQRWYMAHRELTTELRRPENELWVKLSPGKVSFTSLHFFFFFLKSLHLEKPKPENKSINASPKVSLKWSIYSFSVIEKQTERFTCDLRISPSLVFHEVIFIDNWRVLHGRESFTGLRQLCGCYLTRDDILSAARCFGLQAWSWARRSLHFL